MSSFQGVKYAHFAFLFHSIMTSFFGTTKLRTNFQVQLQRGRLYFSLISFHYMSSHRDLRKLLSLASSNSHDFFLLLVHSNAWVHVQRTGSFIIGNTYFDEFWSNRYFQLNLLGRASGRNSNTYSNLVLLSFIDGHFRCETLKRCIWLADDRVKRARTLVPLAANNCVMAQSNNRNS